MSYYDSVIVLHYYSVIALRPSFSSLSFLVLEVLRVCVRATALRANAAGTTELCGAGCVAD